MSILADSARPRAISNWLLAVAAFVFVMVVVGGITRLTESGLSMVRWEPISGVIPPTSEAEWLAEFEAYKAIPEYQQINRGMSLDDFKKIYFWENLHRQFGRLIGLAMLLPLLWFAWKRAIPKGYGPRLSALFALVALQGTIGWWMVSSGLVDRTDVSHYRLAIHLLTAFFFFGGLVWTALDLRQLARNPAARPVRLDRFSIAAFAIVAIQLLFGAYVAGMDAGHAFSSWPLMGDELFPSGGWNPTLPLFGNIFDNPIVVQFIHRWWAWVAVAAAMLLAKRAKPHLPGAILLMGAILIAQVMLGIATLLSGVALPIAAAHQGVATLLVGTLVWCAHRIGRTA